MKSIGKLLIIFLVIVNYSVIAGDTNFSTISRAKTLSLNGLYFAGTDGLQSVLGNPAMLSHLNSKQLEFFVTDNIGQYKYENLKNNLFESYQDDDFSFGGGIFWSFSPSLTAALSYQRAIDYKISWPFVNLFKTDSASSLLAFDYYNQITIDAASASVAIGFNNFSVGASINLYYAEQHSAFPRSNEMWKQGVGLAGYQINYNQDGYSFGFNIGAALQISEKLRAGIMTKSGFSVDLDGSAETRMFSDLDSISSAVNLSGTFEIPWVLGAGLVYDWTDDLTINIDLQYSLWDGIQKTFDFTFDNSKWQQNLSSVDSLTAITSSSFTLALKNSIDAGIGVQYKTSNVILRAGYRYSQSPNADITYNMLFPAVDQHIISAGVEYRMEKLIADVGLAYSFGVTRNINKESSLLAGKYSSDTYTPSVTLRYEL